MCYSDEMLFSLSKKRRLRVDILTIFTVLFLFTSISIILFSYSKNTAAALQVGNTLLARTNQVTVERLKDYIRPTATAQIASQILERDILHGSSDELNSFMQEIILETYHQLTSVYIADGQGNMVFESRVPKDPTHIALLPFINAAQIPPNAQYVWEKISQTKSEALVTTRFLDDNGTTLKTLRNQKFRYDPRQRPWYYGAKTETKNGYWLGIYNAYSTNIPVMTAAIPIRKGNKLIGVLALDISLENISRFLDTLRIGKNGFTFIVNSEHQVITPQSFTPALIKNAPEGILPTINDINDPIISTAYRYHNLTKKDQFSFKLQGTYYLASFGQFIISPTALWEIGTIVPESEFIGVAKITNYYTLLFSFAVLILGLMLIIWAAHSISKPITLLAEETKRLRQLDVDKPTLINTHITEVDTMVDALNSAKIALGSFTKYVPKLIVEQLVRGETIARLGGKKQELTILFTDITNFTEIAEHMEPELLMLHTSEYLEAMTLAIQKYKGSIDKYIGDAIMAFWGAPSPDADHVLHACQASLTCRDMLKGLNERWKKNNKPQMLTRFGINTGTVVVGNVGSSERFNYTALGDNVNLAARLETTNKTYGTDILVNQSVYEQCKDKFYFRPIDRIKIRGKSIMTEIYELVAGKSGYGDVDATPEQIELCELSITGYQAYHYDNDLVKAASIFHEILRQHPLDTVALIYLERCKSFMK